MPSSVETNPLLRRTLSRYAVLGSLGAAIACAASLVFPLGPVLALVVWLAGWEWAILIGAVWCATGALVLVPVLSEGIITWLCGFREPRAHELDRFELAWNDVCRTTALRPDAFALRVLPCPPRALGEPPYINGFSAGVNVVALTADALSDLDDQTLRAILAHELGHHAGLDPMPRGLVAWYLGVVEALLRPISVVPGAAWLRIVYLPIMLILRLSSRPCEYAADAFAKRLGHGGYLAKLLLALPRFRDTTFVGALLASHPANTDRARRLTQLD